MERGDPIAWGGPIAAQRREQLLREVWALGPRPIATTLYELIAKLGGQAAVREADQRLARLAPLAPLITCPGAGDWPAWPLHALGGE